VTLCCTGKDIHRKGREGREECGQNMSDSQTARGSKRASYSDQTARLLPRDELQEFDVKPAKKNAIAFPYAVLRALCVLCGENISNVNATAINGQSGFVQRFAQRGMRVAGARDVFA
jgi:hypothetical protein